MMFMLIDCNDFYASCERLFRPDLRTKPIVVLSNNDGCVIARSNEAKALGIGMGEPFFQIKALCRQHGVEIFSSNYALYGDLSQRVMSIIEQFWPHIEIYSIDEAFLDLSSMPEAQRLDFCVMLQKKILQYTGIPTSIGIGATKTLAKAANYFCKRILKTPVFKIDHTESFFLQQIEITDIWGIGRQWAKKLKCLGITNACELARYDPQILRKKSSVVLMRTALELRGIVCQGLEDVPLRKGIIASRSFGQMQTELKPVAEAISSHCARAVEKLREQELVVHRISIFLHTNRFREDLPQQNLAMEIRLPVPTDDIRVITAYAKKCLRQIFKKGYFYKKVGVSLEELGPRDIRQHDLFYETSQIAGDRAEKFMDVFDNINARFGRKTAFLAAQGCNSTGWEMQGQLKSPAYTTRWEDLPLARL